MKDTPRLRILFFGAILVAIASIVVPTVSVLGLRWYKSRLIQRFVEGVTSKDEALANESIKELFEHRPELVPVVLEAIRNDDRLACYRATRNILESGNAAAHSTATELLLATASERLQGELTLHRVEAVTWLGRIGANCGNELVVPELLRAVDDENESVQFQALSELVSLSAYSPEFVDALKRCLEGANEGTRTYAVFTLTRLVPTSREAIPALIEQLEHVHVGNRLMAASALGIIGADAKEAIPALVKMIGDDENSRQVATRAIQRIDPAALPSEMNAAASEIEK